MSRERRFERGEVRGPEILGPWEGGLLAIETLGGVS